MTKQAQEDIQKLLDKVADILRRIGIPDTQINVATGFRYRTDHYAAAFDWLHDFSISEELAAYKRVWALRPPEVWHHYELVGVEGLQEQVLLQDAGKALAKRWKRKRPRIFGPDRPVEDEDGENEGCESADDSQCTE